MTLLVNVPAQILHSSEALCLSLFSKFVQSGKPVWARRNLRVDGQGIRHFDVPHAPHDVYPRE